MPRNDEVNYDMKCILWWTNIAMENRPDLKMYFLLNMGIFQPAMLVYQRVYFFMKASFRSYLAACYQHLPVRFFFSRDGVLYRHPEHHPFGPLLEDPGQFFFSRKNIEFADWQLEPPNVSGRVMFFRVGLELWSVRKWAGTFTSPKIFNLAIFGRSRALRKCMIYFFWCLYFSHRNCKLYLDLLKGAKLFIKDVNSPSLRVSLAPLGRRWYIFIIHHLSNI